MNRGVVILFHQTLRNQNRIFKVVAAPRHERDQNVAPQRQLAAIRARTIGDYLALPNPLADVNNRALIDAGVLVRTLELDQRVDVRGHFARNRAVHVVIGLDDDAFGVDIVDDAVAARDHHRA